MHPRGVDAGVSTPLLRSHPHRPKSGPTSRPDAAGPRAPCQGRCVCPLRDRPWRAHRRLGRYTHQRRPADRLAGQGIRQSLWLPRRGHPGSLPPDALRTTAARVGLLARRFYRSADSPRLPDRSGRSDQWCKWRFHNQLVFVGIRSAKVIAKGHRAPRLCGAASPPAVGVPVSDLVDALGELPAVGGALVAVVVDGVVQALPREVSR